MDDQQLYNNKHLEKLNRRLDQNLKEIEKQRIHDECIKTINKSILPEDRFSEWIHSICLVTFDIEIGQAIEKIYPSNTKFTPREETNICYLSFPDNNQGLGDTKFHFRTRLCRNRQFNHKNKIDKELLKNYPIDLNFLYGFVYFRQVRDRTARRGYFQKSLVILTKYPFMNLFYELISIIAPRYFDEGENVFIQACKDFDKFPQLMTDQLLNLKILDVNILTFINCKNEQTNGSPTNELSIASIQKKFEEQNENSENGENHQPISTNLTIPFVLSMNVYSSLLPIISHVQLIWELVITCEPIIVMAATPDICSDIVQSLVSIISPLKYSSDFRPFFTIHDSEFKEYTTKTQAPPPVILAVTNPFFAKTLQHWPHIINIRSNNFNNSTVGIKSRLINYAGFSSYDLNSAQLKDSKIHKSESIKTLDNKTGLYTKYKPFLTKDRTVLKQLFKGIEIKRSKDIQDQILRRYFKDLTESFLMPLERYIASLMPLQKNISPFKNIPVINPFNPDDFIKSLETFPSGPQLTTGIKGDWSNLYRRFFRCSNFAAWYESRFREISTKIKTLHIEKLCKSNLIEFISDKDEVEVIDLILSIKEKIATIENENLPVEEDCLPKLNAHLKNIIETLPQDTKSMIKKSLI